MLTSQKKIVLGFHDTLRSCLFSLSLSCIVYVSLSGFIFCGFIKDGLSSSLSSCVFNNTATMTPLDYCA